MYPPAPLCRWLPSLAAAALYAVFILLWHVSHSAYNTLQNTLSFIMDPVPYRDLNSVLQANICAQQGVNVYHANSCMFGGLYNYSPFLLHLAPRLGGAARVPLGIAFGMLFLLAAALLPPARGWRALGLRAAAVCSGVVVWALETGNFDCLLFVFCVLGLCLLLRGQAFGYALFALGGAIKFYPAVLLVLALRERRRLFALIAMLLLLGGALFMWRYGQGVLTALTILPAGLPFRGVFGALNWPFGLALLRFLPVLTMEPDVPQYFAAMQQPYVETYIMLTARLLVVIGLYTAWRLAPAYEARLARLAEAERLYLAAGSIIIAFCFFMAQNLDYRAIFLLLTLPGLQYLAQDRAGRWLLAMVLLLLWEGALRHAVAVVSTAALGGFAVYAQAVFWLLREFAWWFVAVRLAAIAIAWARSAVIALMPGTAMLLRSGLRES